MALNEVSRLWRAARKLERRNGRRKGLPPLLFFTDPMRTPDPASVAARLPRGTGIVFRAFGAPDALEAGRTLARVCRRRHLRFFVGADPRLAARLGADGLHLPERLSGRARAFRPRFLVTAAAHGAPAAMRARKAGAMAIVISPVFASASSSVGRAMGPRVLARLVRHAGAPVYALGGISARTIGRLGMTGVVGVAAVEALSVRKGSD